MERTAVLKFQAGVCLGRRLSILLVALLAVAASGLLGLDVALAKAVIRSHALDPVVLLLEHVTLKSLSEFALPGALLMVGGALWALGHALRGRAVVYVGLVPLIAYLISDLSKPQLGRLRPFEMLETAMADTWFVGGNSFPSGHVAFFAGLAVPIVLLFPRTWPLLVIPAVVAAQRVIATDHYLSDVTTSFALAIVVAIAVSPILRTKETSESGLVTPRPPNSPR